MSRILRRRPSPAMVVAFVALCVALAGTASALPGRARVKKDDIARAAVRRPHQVARGPVEAHRARTVTRSKIARRAINSEPRRPGRAHGRRTSSSHRWRRWANANASKVNNRSVEKIAFVTAPGTARRRC